MSLTKWNAKLDKYDIKLSRREVLPRARWSSVEQGRITKLYAGQLFRGLPQLSEPSTRNLQQDTPDHDERVRNPRRPLSIVVNAWRNP